MIPFNSLAVLAIAAALDYGIGDPRNWLHPVQVIGWGIGRLTQTFLTYLKNPVHLRVAGVFLALLIIFLSGFTSGLIVHTINSLPLVFPLNEILSIGIQSILLASCFAGRGLRDAAEDVLQHLNPNDLTIARQRLSFYVGRDTETLSEPEILRAILETVTENATDGVMAPLFYALIGTLIPGVGSVPLVFAYKAASTLDSMIGYKEPPLTDIGWFSARLEDHLTWLPCRLTVITIALLSGKPRSVWRICQRDAILDPSPNSGWSECTYAAALGVQLGGINKYRGVIKQKPLLGDNLHPITPRVIQQALQLTRYSVLIWLGLFFLGVLSFELVRN